MNRSKSVSPPPNGPLLEFAGRTKILDHHRERLAVVYVRQSTPRQVRENVESTALQYQLSRRATELGWRKDRVLIIDDDLGQSGQTATNRLGFQRLLAELGLNHVGLVLGIEMSRLARSCKDWYQLLELCAVFRSLLADQDGVYDPTDYNDRLLLGLKGTMSEAELHLIRARLNQAKRQKAQRGELIIGLPTGYLMLPGGEVALDPDQQVQSVIRLVFAKFAELGTALGVLAYLRQHQIALPVRWPNGPRPGPLVWRQPRDKRVYDILRNPTYAGAYAYGRSAVDPQQKQAGRTSPASMPMDQWQVLLPDHFPAYISWEQYLANRERMRQNVSSWTTLGAVRQGTALLGGLVYCDRCGYRMQIYYPHARRGIYRCNHPYRSLEERPKCPQFSTKDLDGLVSRQALRALEPAALEVSLQAHADLEQDRQRLHQHWQQQLERARYLTDRARRQYEAVEPENRLVARELEKQWEEALVQQRRLEEEYARFQQGIPAGLSGAECAAIRALANDIGRIWDAATTTPADRQTVIRQLVDRVQVQVQGGSELATVSIHWKGGFTSEHPLHRRLSRFRQMGNYQQLRDRLRSLRATGLTSAEIADRLNAEGFRTPKGKAFNANAIRSLLSREGLSPARGNLLYPEGRGRNEWWVSDLARELDFSTGGLQGWIQRGWVHARQVPYGGRYWVVWADAEEMKRLRKLAAQRRPPFPAELTRPKPRPSEKRGRSKGRAKKRSRTGQRKR